MSSFEEFMRQEEEHIRMVPERNALRDEARRARELLPDAEFVRGRLAETLLPNMAMGGAFAKMLPTEMQNAFLDEANRMRSMFPRTDSPRVTMNALRHTLESIDAASAERVSADELTRREAVIKRRNAVLEAQLETAKLEIESLTEQLERERCPTIGQPHAPGCWETD
jgi:hypothetical protein